MSELDIAAFLEADVLSLAERETALLSARCSAQEQPRAILLAGQPGAGKTELSTMILSQLGNGAAFINGDDYRRYHPNYRKLYERYGADTVQMTSAFSSAVTERLIAALSDIKIDLVVEGTGRTVTVPQTTAKILMSKGYTVEMAIIAARPEVSLTSTLRRFYQMSERGTIPRSTAVTAHDAVVAALPSNLDALLLSSCISRMRIWDRDLLLLFDSTTSFERPSAALRGYWDRPWPVEELSDLQRQLKALWDQEDTLHLGQEETLRQLTERVRLIERSGDQIFG